VVFIHQSLFPRPARRTRTRNHWRELEPWAGLSGFLTPLSLEQRHLPALDTTTFKLVNEYKASSSTSTSEDAPSRPVPNMLEIHDAAPLHSSDRILLPQLGVPDNTIPSVDFHYAVLSPCRRTVIVASSDFDYTRIDIFDQNRVLRASLTSRHCLTSSKRRHRDITESSEFNQTIAVPIIKWSLNNAKHPN
jgi:hypothetical protein